MDPVSVIVAALTVGAGAGLKDTASHAVKDAYGVLRELVRGRVGSRSVAQTMLAEQILAAAQRLLEPKHP